MRLLCDTNVVLDVILHQEPFFRASSLALSYCEDESVTAYLSATSLTDIYYIVHQASRDKTVAYQALEAALEIFTLCHTTDEDVARAVAGRHREFEDGLLAAMADRLDCNLVLTRNKKDFKDHQFRAVTPAEFVKMSL